MQGYISDREALGVQPKYHYTGLQWILRQMAAKVITLPQLRNDDPARQKKVPLLLKRLISLRKMMRKFASSCLAVSACSIFTSHGSLAPGRIIVALFVNDPLPGEKQSL